MIMRFLKRPFRFAILFSFMLIVAVTYVLLDAFVIPRALSDMVLKSGVSGQTSYATLSPEPTNTDTSTIQSTNPSGSVTSDVANTSSGAITSPPGMITNVTSYSDNSIAIKINTVRLDDTTTYVADIRIAACDLLKTAMAGNTLARNVLKTTSAMASEHRAIFAINGDYASFRNSGYVVRNGQSFRTTASSGETLCIDKSGNFSIFTESSTSLSSVKNAWQIFSFGPGLIENGVITVDATTGVAKELPSNPRTAIGQIGALHYLVVVSDGRTSVSAGLSLLKLAQLMQSYGCINAYNLDGGGSSTMVLNGKVINIPTDGQKMGEREVSDIVYIGYGY